MTLCSSCGFFSLHSFSKDPDGIRAYKLESVQQAARGNCELCKLFITVLNDDIACAPYPLSRTWIRMRFSSDLERKQAYAGLAYNKFYIKLANSVFPKPRREIDDGGKEHELCIAADGGSSAAREGDVLGRYLGEDPSSDRHVATILCWLQECDGHESCNQTISGKVHLNTQQAPLPTRCLDVQGADLVLRETNGLFGTYIALSHRWNEETEKCKTTTANLKGRLIRLEFSNLSMLFQDAITLTRRLGFRFIWIDSLCIVQSGDSGRDWSKEAFKMGQYYQYCMFTIAATASSSHCGFLSPRVRRPFTSLARLPYRDKGNTCAGYMYIYQRLESIEDQYLTGVWNSELLQRGWVFQEWLLSRRVVYFTSSQIFLECAAGRLNSESGDTIQSPDIPAGLERVFALKPDLKFNPSTVGDTWYHMLEIYSRLQFTMAGKDRIIAMAGIASEVRDVYALENETKKLHLPLEYVSGLWLRDVHHGLLWEQKKAPTEYFRIPSLPSWSWASILLEVKWPKRRRWTQPAFRVISLISATRARYHVTTSHHSPSQVSDESSIPLLRTDAENLLDDADDRITNDVVSSRSYDVDNTFTALHIRAHIIHLLQRGAFSSKAHLRTAARTTGVDIPEYDLVPWIGTLQAGTINPGEWEAALGIDSASKPWRAICSPKAPDIIVGWGSFERSLSPSQSGTVEALHVSTDMGVPSGLVVGTLNVSHEVANVLFVECTGGVRYRRIGVGKIFDRNVFREFCSEALRDVELE